MMRVLVAGGAGGRQSQVGPVQIFDADRTAFLCADSWRRVAAIAVQPTVFSFKRVSRLFVVECFDVPFDQREIFAIVFRVTARALLV